MNNECFVCIRCVAYNQESYIRECLDGFVMQKTNFKFVAIVHDDASTDKTADIIREYEAKYPNIIKPIYETENQYSKHDGSLRRIMDEAVAATGAKYVAMCEGDDYWTQPNKLQKQVDFLEEHGDYAMCCHGAYVLNETDRMIDCQCENMVTREYFPDDAFPQWQIPTASILYNRKMIDSYPIVRGEDFMAGDVVLILRCMHAGRVWGFEDKMSVYRMNRGGVTGQKLSKEGLERLCVHYDALMENFPKINADYCHRFISMVYYSKFRNDFGLKKKARALWIAWKNCPQYVLRKFFKIKGAKRNDLFYQHYGC